MLDILYAYEKDTGVGVLGGEVRTMLLCHKRFLAKRRSGFRVQERSTAGRDILEAVFFVMIFAVSAHNAVQK